MATNRPKIPSDTARAIFIGAGHRCACCGTPFPIERAHIVPWKDCRDHSAHNLLCLCANCHEMADSDWDRITFFEYKRRPWVNRQFAFQQHASTSGRAEQPKAVRDRPMSEAEAVLEIIASIVITPSPNRDAAERHEPAALINRAVAAVVRGDFEDLWQAMWPADVSTTEIDLFRASRGLMRVTSAPVAIGIAAVLAHAQRGSERPTLSSWLQHSVPEVGAIAAMVLTGRGPIVHRPPNNVAPFLGWLASYAERSDRFPGSHAVLQYFFALEHLLRFARRMPSFLWELLANDRHFAGIQQSHIPMPHPGHQFRFLMRHESWKARELGAAIVCPTLEVPLQDKLRLLDDPEPRVRFRALEGLLLSSHGDSLGTIADAMLASPLRRIETRTWRVTDYPGAFRCVVAVLDDSSAPQPASATSAFGMGGESSVTEALDVRRLALRGVIEVWPGGNLMYETPAWRDACDVVAAKMPKWIKRISLPNKGIQPTAQRTRRG